MVVPPHIVTMGQSSFDSPGVHGRPHTHTMSYTCAQPRRRSRARESDRELERQRPALASSGGAALSRARSGGTRRSGGVTVGLAAGQAVTCPGRKPPFLAVKPPARPHKSALQNLFTVGNAEAA